MFSAILTRMTAGSMAGSVEIRPCVDIVESVTCRNAIYEDKCESPGYVWDACEMPSCRTVAPLQPQRRATGA